MPLTLRRGDSGPAVADLHAQLAELGLLQRKARDEVARCLFGPETAIAVAVFQAEHDLIPDSIVDLNTAAALDAAAPR